MRVIKQWMLSRKMRMDTTSVIYWSAIIHNMRHQRDAIRVGAGTHIKGELLTFAHGGEISIGDHCYLGDQSRVWSAKSISIGDRVLISHNVNIFDSLTHPISPRERHKHYLEIVTNGHPRRADLGEAPVQIDDDVWIGCLSIVLRGVTIGKGAIVGAGSVVSKDVPPFTVVAGNPARIIRELDPDER